LPKVPGSSELLFLRCDIFPSVQSSELEAVFAILALLETVLKHSLNRRYLLVFEDLPGFLALTLPSDLAINVLTSIEY
jgi:hypothetical protein